MARWRDWRADMGNRSDYTGYALSPASWISGGAWLGVFVASAGVMFVSWARWRHDLRLTIRAYDALSDRPK